MAAIRIGLLIVLCGLPWTRLSAESPARVSSRPIARDIIQPVFIGFSEKELDILDVLEQKAAADFLDKPLSEALALLAKRHGIPIRIEQLALDNAGISADEKVTTRQTDRKLRVVLSQLLKPLELGWMIDEDSVVITTADQCFPVNVIAVYPIADLNRGGRNPRAVSEVIRYSTNSMWEDSDGAGGSIRHFRRGKSLLIAQPLSVHYEIIQVLACLRAGQRISRELDARRKHRTNPRTD